MSFFWEEVIRGDQNIHRGIRELKRGIHAVEVGLNQMEHGLCPCNRRCRCTHQDFCNFAGNRPRGNDNFGFNEF